MGENLLHWADYVILVAFLASSFAVGAYHALTGGQQRTTQEFLLGDRQLAIIPTVLSMVMSYLSALIVIGGAGETYDYGAMQLMWNIPGDCLGLLLIAYVVVPWIYPLKVVSIFQYLELRYRSRSIRYVGAFVGVLHSVLYTGISIYAPSVALESVTGLSVNISIPLLAVVATAYTTLGGIRGVVWTDVFQGAVMLGGIIAILIKGVIVCGGVSEIFNIARENERLVVTTASFDPRVRNTMWNVTLHSFLMVVFIKGFSQASVQRYCGTKSKAAAKRTILGNILVTPPFFIIVIGIGITVYAYYVIKGCDPIASGVISSSNKVLPYFVEEIFKNNVGFSGLFIATLYSGSLSGGSAIIWEDVLKHRLRTRLTEYQKTLLTKLIVVILGVLGLLTAFLASVMGGPVLQIGKTFVGACAGPMVALFLMAGLCRSSNHIGAISAVLTGFSTSIFLSFGSRTVPAFTKPLPPAPITSCWPNSTQDGMTNVSEPTGYKLFVMTNNSEPEHLSILEKTYQVSFVWYSTIGFCSAFLVGMAVSLLTNAIFPNIAKQNAAIADKYLMRFIRSQDDEDRTDEDNEDITAKKDSLLDTEC